LVLPAFLANRLSQPGKEVAEYGMNMISARVYMRVILGAFVLASVSPGIVVAQSLRDDWQHLRNLVDFELHLDHSLEDAPLTAEERVQIYTQIDGKFIHDSFRDDQRKEERKVVLSARAGLIALAHNDSQQILVRGPKQLCGGTGNCLLWIFIRQRGEARLILAEEGTGLLAGSGSYQGFTDLLVPFHHSGFETLFRVYRWNNLEYKRTNCYVATSDPFHLEKPAAIQDCPGPPR
jgi:hypothetical protein